MGSKIPPSLEARLTRARLLGSEGRSDESVEELRQAVLDAAVLPNKVGRARVEEILRFAKDNGTFEEIEDILETESLLERFYGSECERSALEWRNIPATSVRGIRSVARP